MKKIISLSLVISVLFIAAVFSGCSSGGLGGVKTGIAVINSLAGSASAGDKDGLAQVDSTIVAVIIDGGNKIAACAIDAVQTKIKFSGEGKLITSKTTEIKSKNELGEGYGLKGSSSLGKEWNEQAAAFASYVVGKTVAEVKGIAVSEDGKAADADLLSSVTIHIGDFIAGIEKAASAAQNLGASASDKLAVSSVTNISNSKDASSAGAADTTDGLAQADSVYMALTTNSGGVITSCVIDSSQGKVNFNNTGKITTDLTVAPRTKNELGEEYGLKKSSSIGKEWNEQAAAFAKYITGKTVAEVKGIAVSDDGKAAGADLLSSVTIHIADFITLAEKAAK